MPQANFTIGLSGEEFIAELQIMSADAGDVQQAKADASQAAEQAEQQVDLAEQHKDVAVAAAETANQVLAGNHVHTKAQLGFGNVDDTSDAEKPLSSAAKAALAALLTSKDNLATSTLTRTAQRTELNVFGISPIYTLDADSFLNAKEKDLVIVRKLVSADVVTIITDTGLFFHNNVDISNTVEMEAGKAFTAEFHKRADGNFNVRVY